jgi:hypothetical protein
LDGTPFQSGHPESVLWFPDKEQSSHLDGRFQSGHPENYVWFPDKEPSSHLDGTRSQSGYPTSYVWFPDKEPSSYLDDTGFKEVILKGSVVQLSHFTKYRAVVSSNVSYSGRLGFEQLSTEDFPYELSGGFLLYAKKYWEYLQISFNRFLPRLSTPSLIITLPCGTIRI